MPKISQREQILCDRILRLTHSLRILEYGGEFITKEAKQLIRDRIKLLKSDDYGKEKDSKNTQD